MNGYRQGSCGEDTIHLCNSMSATREAADVDRFAWRTSQRRERERNYAKANNDTNRPCGKE